MLKDTKDVISQDDRCFLDSNGISTKERSYHDSVLEYVHKCSDNDSLKKREVWWFVETYLQPCDFEYALNKAIHWAYIYHDQDNNEPHFHILLHYDNARTGTAVLRDFCGFQNTFIQKCKKGPCACYEYLTHKNDPDKYQYNADRIISHNSVYWSHFLPDIRDRTDTDFIEDLLNTEKLDYYMMAKKYGRDFMKNWRNYVDFRQEVLWQRRVNGGDSSYK